MTRATRAGLIKFALLTGAADSHTAGIACAAQDGIKIGIEDIIIGVLELAETTNTWTDVTATSYNTIAGKLLCPTSANDTIVVWWMVTEPSPSAGLLVDSPFVRAEVGTGALANTAITIAGINGGASPSPFAALDILIAAIEINTTTGAWTDRTANTTITAENEVKCSDSTNGNMLFVIWMDLTGPRAFSSLNLQFGIATMDASPTQYPSSATLTGINDEDTLLVALEVDETDYNVIDELTSVITVDADDTLTVSEPSPVASAESKILCFYHKANDLAA